MDSASDHSADLLATSFRSSVGSGLQSPEHQAFSSHLISEVRRRSLVSGGMPALAPSLAEVVLDLAAILASAPLTGTIYVLFSFHG